MTSVGRPLAMFGLALGLGCAPARPADRGGPTPGGSTEPVDAGPRAVDAFVTPAETTPEPESGGPYVPTTRVESAGKHIAAVELWHSPTPSSPRGTVLALANGDDRSAMVEIDIATGTPLMQRSLDLPPGAGLLMRRDGDQIHLGAQGDDAFLWITLDAALSEVRRTLLPRMGRKTLTDRYDAFGVHDGYAIVLTHSATAHVFDGKGRKTGVHSCAPLSFFGFTVGRIGFADGRAFALRRG